MHWIYNQQKKKFPCPGLTKECNFLSFSQYDCVQANLLAEITCILNVIANLRYSVCFPSKVIKTCTGQDAEAAFMILYSYNISKVFTKLTTTYFKLNLLTDKLSITSGIFRRFLMNRYILHVFAC